MSKTKTKSPPHTVRKVSRKTPASATQAPLFLPQHVCQLLGVSDPRKPGRSPLPRPGYCTVWDPGLSLQCLQRRHPTLFHDVAWANDLAFLKLSLTHVPGWRQLCLEPPVFDADFAAQATLLPKGDEVPLAREVVTLLVVRFLATGERWPAYRLRCRDVLPSGRRVVVGPFWDTGVDLANCGDAYHSPGVGLASATAFPPRR